MKTPICPAALNHPNCINHSSDTCKSTNPANPDSDNDCPKIWDAHDSPSFLTQDVARARIRPGQRNRARLFHTSTEVQRSSRAELCIGPAACASPRMRTARAGGECLARWSCNFIEARDRPFNEVQLALSEIGLASVAGSGPHHHRPLYRSDRRRRWRGTQIRGLTHSQRQIV